MVLAHLQVDDLEGLDLALAADHGGEQQPAHRPLPVRALDHLAGAEAEPPAPVGAHPGAADARAVGLAVALCTLPWPGFVQAEPLGTSHSP